MGEDTKVERVYTPEGKRRSVVKVLKSALQDSQRETAVRVVGIFGVVVKQDGTASLLSALTIDEFRVVLKAVPEAIGKITAQFKTGGAMEKGN